ncbi:plasma membrane proteolipid Pmp3 [Pestalotiopsis sp. 9143b]|nr:plasma membrane proteolipid Pmp3 [Pestalotiopsis sp. 9143b]
MPFTGSDIFKIILAIILPPVGVFLERGCGADFCINVLLTILGYIPGIIHALIRATNDGDLAGINSIMSANLRNGSPSSNSS